MRTYHIPPRTDDEEKIIMGVLSLKQAAFLGAGLILGFVVGVALFVVVKWFGVFIGIIIGSLGLPFAFYKKNGLSLIENMKRKKEFERKTKELINRIE